jgi:hypothetical protein
MEEVVFGSLDSGVSKSFLGMLDILYGTMLELILSLGVKMRLLGSMLTQFEVA